MKNVINEIKARTRPLIRRARKLGPFKKIERRLDAIESEIGVKKDPGHKWDRLQIALTDLCNCMCRHCTREPDVQFHGTLPLDTFDKYLSCFSPHWFDTLLISDWGETLIIENLLEYLYLAKRKGWDCVEFVTGDRLFDRHEPIWEEAISQNLIGRLFISTEAATPELFEDIRGHKFENFDRLLSGVTRFKQKYQSPLEINFGVTCMKANLKDLPNIIPLAAGFGVSTIYMRHLDTVQFAISRKSNKLCIPEQHLNSIDRKEVLAVFEKVIHLGKKYKIEVALPERFPEITSKIGHLVAKAEKKIRIRCYEPFKWVQVWFSGDIFPCCYTDHAYSLGSINNLDFYSIWNNLKYKRLIDGLRPGGDPIDACKRCNVLGLPDRVPQ